MRLPSFGLLVVTLFVRCLALKNDVEESMLLEASKIPINSCLHEATLFEATELFFELASPSLLDAVNEPIFDEVTGITYHSSAVAFINIILLPYIVYMLEKRSFKDFCLAVSHAHENTNLASLIAQLLNFTAGILPKLEKLLYSLLSNENAILSLDKNSKYPSILCMHVVLRTNIELIFQFYVKYYGLCGSSGYKQMRHIYTLKYVLENFARNPSHFLESSHPLAPLLANIPNRSALSVYTCLIHQFSSILAAGRHMQTFFRKTMAPLDLLKVDVHGFTSLAEELCSKQSIIDALCSSFPDFWWDLCNMNHFMQDVIRLYVPTVLYSVCGAFYQQLSTLRQLVEGHSDQHSLHFYLEQADTDLSTASKSLDMLKRSLTELQARLIALERFNFGELDSELRNLKTSLLNVLSICEHVKEATFFDLPLEGEKIVVSSFPSIQALHDVLYENLYIQTLSVFKTQILSPFSNAPMVVISASLSTMTAVIKHWKLIVSSSYYRAFPVALARQLAILLTGKTFQAKRDINFEKILLKLFKYFNFVMYVTNFDASSVARIEEIVTASLASICVVYHTSFSSLVECVLRRQVYNALRIPESIIISFHSTLEKLYCLPELLTETPDGYEFARIMMSPGRSLYSSCFEYYHDMLEFMAWFPLNFMQFGNLFFPIVNSSFPKLDVFAYVGDKFVFGLPSQQPLNTKVWTEFLKLGGTYEVQEIFSQYTLFQVRSCLSFSSNTEVSSKVVKKITCAEDVKSLGLLDSFEVCDSLIPLLSKRLKMESCYPKAFFDVVRAKSGVERKSPPLEASLTFFGSEDLLEGIYNLALFHIHFLKTRASYGAIICSISKYVHGDSFRYHFLYCRYVYALVSFATSPKETLPFLKNLIHVSSNTTYCDIYYILARKVVAFYLALMQICSIMTVNTGSFAAVHLDENFLLLRKFVDEKDAAVKSLIKYLDMYKKCRKLDDDEVVLSFPRFLVNIFNYSHVGTISVQLEAYLDCFIKEFSFFLAARAPKTQASSNRNRVPCVVMLSKRLASQKPFSELATWNEKLQNYVVHVSRDESKLIHGLTDQVSKFKRSLSHYRTTATCVSTITPFINGFMHYLEKFLRRHVLLSNSSRKFYYDRLHNLFNAFFDSSTYLLAAARSLNNSENFQPYLLPRSPCIDVKLIFVEMRAIHLHVTELLGSNACPLQIFRSLLSLKESISLIHINDEWGRGLEVFDFFGFVKEHFSMGNIAPSVSTTEEYAHSLASCSLVCRTSSSTATDVYASLISAAREAINPQLLVIFESITLALKMKFLPGLRWRDNAIVEFLGYLKESYNIFSLTDVDVDVTKSIRALRLFIDDYCAFSSWFKVYGLSFAPLVDVHPPALISPLKLENSNELPEADLFSPIFVAFIIFSKREIEVYKANLMLKLVDLNPDDQQEDWMSLLADLSTKTMPLESIEKLMDLMAARSGPSTDELAHDLAICQASLNMISSLESKTDCQAIFENYLRKKKDNASRMVVAVNDSPKERRPNKSDQRAVKRQELEERKIYEARLGDIMRLQGFLSVIMHGEFPSVYDASNVTPENMHIILHQLKTFATAFR